MIFIPLWPNTGHHNTINLIYKYYLSYLTCSVCVYCIYILLTIFGGREGYGGLYTNSYHENIKTVCWYYLNSVIEKLIIRWYCWFEFSTFFFFGFWSPLFTIHGQSWMVITYTNNIDWSGCGVRRQDGTFTLRYSFQDE